MKGRKIGVSDCITLGSWAAISGWLIYSAPSMWITWLIVGAIAGGAIGLGASGAIAIDKKSKE